MISKIKEAETFEIKERDWTCDENGVYNSSQAFNEISEVIHRIIRNDAHMLLSGQSLQTARLILARLAHRYGMAPHAGDK